MNSVLQLLFHLPVFRRLIFSVEDTSRLTILHHLQQLFAAMTIPRIRPTDDFTADLGWPDEARRVQHDAVEFLHCLLGYLSSALPPPFSETFSDLLFSKTSTESCLTIDIDITSSAATFGESARRRDIRAPSPILLVQLQQTSCGTSEKSVRARDYPDVFTEFDEPYRLHGVVVHEGSFTDRGHYHAVLRPWVLDQ